MAAALPDDDLDTVLSKTGELWSLFSGARIFLTGGTGFLGRWLVESVQRANDTLRSGIEIAVLTRDPQRAIRQAPHCFDRRDVRLIAGDARDFEGAVGSVDYCIHAATDVRASLKPERALDVYDAIVEGTRHVLDVARGNGARRFLLTSSGAVYGPQPSTSEHVKESDRFAPLLHPQAAYGNAKRASEWLANAYAAESGGSFGACAARIFAVIGPGLPLDGGFAAGNFVADAIANRAVRVAGDGRAVRSYLYAADVAVWLLHILQRGASGEAYNVGSRHAVSILELANEVERIAASGRHVRVDGPPGPGTPPERYVPDTRKAQEQLGLEEYTTFPAAIEKTMRWSRARVFA